MKNSLQRLVLVVGASLSIASGAYASEIDAKEVFSIAASGGLTFSHARVVDDVQNVFLQFTSSGRNDLINEIERLGVLAEAIGKKLSVTSEVPLYSVRVKRRVGKDGLDEYAVDAEVKLQWMRCPENGLNCKATGTAKSLRVEGVVVQAQINGRPAYRVSSVRYDGSIR